MTGQTATKQDLNTEWWRGALIYQVYLRSFVDSNEDGIGDIPGFISKLDYIRDLGVNAIWITPFYPSPMKDFGYDVTDYKAVDPVFGTMDDFDQMVKQAHERGLKIILDHVWSHTSEEHPWFKASADPDHPEHEKYKDWYVWQKSKVIEDGTEDSPNNWRSVFAGSSWEYHPKRGMYFLHNFLKEQPDLNWHNPAVRNAIYDVARFWLSKGVDGFRLDVCNFYAHDPDLRDNPVREQAFPGTLVQSFDDHHNIHNINREENLLYLSELQKVFADFPNTLSLGEMAAVTVELMADYVQPGNRLDAAYSSFLVYPHYPEASEIEYLLRDNGSVMSGKTICWVTGTHDFHRVATRWKAANPSRQKDLVVQAMALLLAMPGIASVYQGEELGLEQAPITFEEMRDPQGINFGQVEKSRDGCRVPIPWTADGSTLGFGATESWLPIPDSYRQFAVDVQEKEGDSRLNIIKDLIALRQNHVGWKMGEVKNIERHGSLIRFDKSHGDESFHFLFNFSTTEDQGLDGWESQNIVHGQGFSKHGNRVSLAPYGFVIGHN